MQVKKTEFDGLLILQPKIFKDERGLFFESWNESVFKSHGINISFIQDNQSVSKKNVLRGLHFQNYPHNGYLFFELKICSNLTIFVFIFIKSHNYFLNYSEVFKVFLRYLDCSDFPSINNYVKNYTPVFTKNSLSDRKGIPYLCNR